MGRGIYGGTSPVAVWAAMTIWREIRRGLEGLWGLARASALDPFPLRRDLGAYTLEKGRADFRAGGNLALLDFPQAIAYAMVAGLPIGHGVLCAVIAGLVGPLLSGTRFIVMGPTNATAVLLFGVFLGLGYGPEERVASLPILVGLTGAFLVAGALLRVANLLQYISRSVVTGYISAAAVYIVVNQLRVVLGIRFDVSEGGTFFDVIGMTVGHLPEAKVSSAAVALATAAGYWFFVRRVPRVPPVVATIVSVSVLAVVADFVMARAGLGGLLGERVAVMGEIGLGGWRLSPPAPDYGMINQLAGSAMVLAFLCVLEGTSIGKSLAARGGERLNANQAMLGMGVANLACGWGGAMPTSGSLTRSQLSFDSRARTPVACMVSGALCLVGAVLIGPLLRYVPKPALAVLVIFIGFSLIDRHVIRVVMRSTKSDATVFLATFISALVLRLDFAIILGALTSIILFLRKVSTPELVEYSFNEQGNLYEIEGSGKRPNPKISIVHVEGELFFGASELFRDQARRVCEDPNLKVIILRMRNAYRLDATSVLALEELIRYMRETGRALIISGAMKDVYKVVRNSGLLDVLGRENFFMGSAQNPNVATRNALKRAQEILGPAEPEVEILYDPSKGGQKGG